MTRSGCPPARAPPSRPLRPRALTFLCLVPLVRLILLPGPGPARGSRLPQPAVSTLQGLPPTKSITHELLLLLDVDRNGHVTFDEFDRLLEQYNLQSADHFDIAPDEGVQLFRQLDVDADSAISQEEIATAMRRNSTFVRMSSEDVQVWLDCCTDGLKQYRAHFLENDAQGIDLVHATRQRPISQSIFPANPAAAAATSHESDVERTRNGGSRGVGTSRKLSTTSITMPANKDGPTGPPVATTLPPTTVTTTPMHIAARDQRYLRAAVIGGLLRSYYGSNHAPLLPAPKLIEARSTMITLGIVQPPSLKYRSRVVKYKVQVCRTSGAFGWQKRTSSIPECGFGWESIWPSAGVSTVRFIGLSPMTSYRFRVRAFHCDGKSIVGEERDINTNAPHTKKSIVLSPTKWLRMCFLRPLRPATPHVISKTPNSVLLEWGRSCKVRASYLRMLSECSDVPDRPGWDIPGLARVSSFVRSQMYCTRQRFIVQYVEYGTKKVKAFRTRWSSSSAAAAAPSGSARQVDAKAEALSETGHHEDGDSVGGASLSSADSDDPTSDGSRESEDATFLPGVVADALCSQQDENTGPNGGNDNPLDCLVRDLRPGKMYLFRLAVEADGMRSEFTEPIPVSFIGKINSPLGIFPFIV